MTSGKNIVGEKGDDKSMVIAEKCYVAVDIGASSGRVIVGTHLGPKLELDEMHRFENKMREEAGHFYWDIDHLFQEIVSGLKKVADANKSIESIGIDTWAVDYVLLGEDNQPVSKVFAYRDPRTNQTMDEVFGHMTQKEIYQKTGIAFMQFNTLYQLYEHTKAEEVLKSRKLDFMMVPDYLNFLLCGVKAVEYTNATSTQMLNIQTNTWDAELIALTGLQSESFPKLVQPGTILGELFEEIQALTGLGSVKVIAPATHDTGSAVVSVPAFSKDFAYISSGTWSLMGIESRVPINSEGAGAYNFTNEGGVAHTYRFLKNIMGLWLIQEVKRLLEPSIGFGELVEAAKNSRPFACLINPNDPRFLNPKNMITEIQGFCRETDQYVPTQPGELARCIFESLAFLYNQVLIELREVQEQSINRIHIIGGGTQNEFLNQLCADFTQCEVFAGPVEATAIGNLAVQMMAMGVVDNLEAARKIIFTSFEVKHYQPNYTELIEENWYQFRRLNHVR